MQIITIGRWKYPDILSKRRADHNEVLIQIRSAHRKFLRVTKSHDYMRLESWQFDPAKMLHIQIQSWFWWSDHFSWFLSQIMASERHPKVTTSIRLCATNESWVTLWFGAAQEMRVGPSEPACRSRLQTTLSCIGKEPLWWALRRRHGEIDRVRCESGSRA